jgi:hypothetical protein
MVQGEAGYIHLSIRVGHPIPYGIAPGIGVRGHLGSIILKVAKLYHRGIEFGFEMNVELGVVRIYGEGRRRLPIEGGDRAVVIEEFHGEIIFFVRPYPDLYSSFGSQEINLLASYKKYLMHLELALYVYLDGGIEAGGRMVYDAVAAAGNGSDAAVAVGYPIDCPLPCEIRRDGCGRCNVASVCPYDDGLLYVYTAGLSRHYAPGDSIQGDAILELIDGEVADVEADGPGYGVVITFAKVSSPYVIAVLVGDVQEIGEVIIDLIAGIMEGDGGGYAELSAIGEEVIAQADASGHLAGDRLDADIGIGGQGSGRDGQLQHAVGGIQCSAGGSNDPGRGAAHRRADGGR